MQIEDMQVIQSFNGTTPKLGELPNGWVWTRVGDVLEAVEKTRPETKPNDEFVYLDIASIDNKQQKIVQPKRYLGKEAPSRARQVVRSGDLLFSTVRTYLKNIALVGESYDGQIASTGFTVIRCHNKITTKLMFYLIQTDDFLNSLTEIQRGTSYPAVRDSDVFARALPLPPLPDQHRIVAKIEELFTSLDAGIEALNKIKAQLKHYRQAVLKSAFEVKLTEEWRRAHKQELESASALLQRIREERKKDAKGKYKELPPLDISDLPYLPQGWVWTKLGEITKGMKNGIYKPLHFYSDHGIVCLRMYNIQDGSIVWENLKRMNLSPEETEEYELIPDDILVNRVNSRELVGKSALIPQNTESCVYESKNIRLRLYTSHVKSKYINFWFQFFNQTYFNRNAQQTVGMASMNQEQLSLMPIPLPSLP